MAPILIGHRPISIQHLLPLLVGVILAVRAQQETSTDPLVSLRLRSTPEGLYYATVLVGGGGGGAPATTVGQPRPFDLLVCSICETWWVPSVGEHHQFAQVYPTRRPTEVHSRLPQTGNGRGEAALDFHLDQVQLADLVVEGASVGVAHHFAPGSRRPHEPQPQPSTSGVLGFSVVPDNDQPNPLKLLANRGLIRRPVVALYLADPSGQGLLTFGGHNQSLLAEGAHFEWVPLTSSWSEARYQDNFDKGKCRSLLRDVRLDWGRVRRANSSASVPDEVAEFSFLAEAPAGTEANGAAAGPAARPAELYLDSSAALFVGNQRYLDKYLVDFMGARRFGLAGNYAFEDCRLDNKPDFVFQLRDSPGVELRLAPEDYVLADYEHAPNGRRYCLAAFLAVPVDEWTLGTRFLRNYYTLFDYANMRVGFAQPARVSL